MKLVNLKRGAVVYISTLAKSCNNCVLFFPYKIRAVTNIPNLVSAWSEPIVKNVSTDVTRPEDVTDKQFNVTRFSYGYVYQYDHDTLLHNRG